uniref:SCP domain-containing protein n=1 Tax=Glossina palpalis gambiensis TaxID=67801 RepID=A0A1B0C5P9_9MUSC
MRSIFFLTFLLSFSTELAHSWKYCGVTGLKNPMGGDICFEGTEHSFCNPKERFEEKALYFSEHIAAFVPTTRKFKRVVLQIHNEYRNNVAGGKAHSKASNSYFPIAGRMRELVWDDELEYNAKLHLAAAKMMAHDNCRNTVRYILAGQNLGSTATDNKMTVLEAVVDQLKLMYNEKDLVTDTSKFADKLRSEDVQRSGHFTQLMGDRNSRVGCAFALGLNCTHHKGDAKVYSYCYYLACHYDFSNVSRWRLYKTHPNTPGAHCSEWNVGMNTDPRYSHLCEATPNELFDYSDKNG